MIFLAKARRLCFIAGFGLLLAGCWRSYDSPGDEQKEANYNRGKSLLTRGDYPGAADAFEKALEVNPRNASAHFELWFLYEQHLKDYVSALYHGTRFRKLRPDSTYSGLVRQHMDSCIQELAKNAPLGPVTPQLQREIERLNNQNKDLHLQIAALTEKLALATNRPPPIVSREDTPARENRLAPAAAPPNRTAGASARAPVRTGRPLTVVAAKASASYFKAIPPRNSVAKTRVVKPRETLTTIARQYGLSVNALQKANPSIDARRLRAGQTLKIPDGKSA
jgi:tetratricopeptide (TPR) repeat protein